jgi:acyl-coenzyme A synthetase/AMP-(fatty) acid ligase
LRRNILFAEKRENFSDSALNKLITSFIIKFPQTRLTWLEDSMREIDKEAVAVPREKKDILYLVHSSGTTGFPKAVILQNGPQSHAMRGWLCYVHVSRKKDKAYLAVPNNHQAVILSFNSLLLMGMKVYWASAYDSEGFEADKIINELEQGGYTGFFGFPIAYTQLKEKLQNSERLKKMRFWASTADASHEAIIKKFVRTGSAFKSLGIPINGSVFLDAQGSSEVGTPSVLRYITPFTRKFERRIGKPGSTPFGPKIRVKTISGKPVNINEPGRLEVKGKTVFTGYWKNPAQTYKYFTDGWFFTGDTVRINKDGNVVQLDREVDVIHTATGEIYSLLIEEKIHKHPAIFDACVYGAYDKENFQTPQIAVALRSGYDYDEHTLLIELNKLLADKEQLVQCRIIEWSEFPIGITGKTLKRIFRERSKKLLLNDNKIISPDFL